MPPFVLIEAKIEVSRQRMERVERFVKTYQESSGHDPSDVEIAYHIKCQGQYDVVSWVNPSDHHRSYVVACSGLWLIEWKMRIGGIRWPDS